MFQYRFLFNSFQRFSKFYIHFLEVVRAQMQAILYINLYFNRSFFQFSNEFVTHVLLLYLWGINYYIQNGILIVTYQTYGVGFWNKVKAMGYGVIMLRCMKKCSLYALLQIIYCLPFSKKPSFEFNINVFFWN